jgi:hypothetical protein
MAPRILPVTIAAIVTTAAIASFVALPCSASTTRTGAAATDAARRAIQTLYNSEDNAASRKDIGGVFAQTAPDFRAIDQNGKTISLAQAKANIAELFSEASSVQGSTSIERFRRIGNAAVVTAKSRDVVLFTDSSTGEQGRVTIDDLSVDTWVRSGKAWLQTRSHDISQTIHRDPVASPPTYDPMLS